MPGVPIVVTPRAVDVLKRALEAGRMDPARVGVRVSLARGMRGSEVRTGFAEAPEPGDETLDAGGIRLFIPAEIAAGDSVIDVADEHDRIVLRTPD
jgi:Fe-S cluster assembly iron-binding protein IscA